MATRTIYLGKPLLDLSEKVGRGGKFSATVNSIVNKYSTIMELTEVPTFTEKEKTILSEIVNDNRDDNIKFRIRSLHLAVLDSGKGTAKDRDSLSKKIEKLSAAQRIKIYEMEENK